MEILVYVANILYVLAFYMQDMVRLRIFTIVGATCLLVYFYLQPVPMMTVVCWNMFFIVLNIVQLWRILVTRKNNARHRQPNCRIPTSHRGAEQPDV